MLEGRRTQYAKTGDLHVAHQVLGARPIDLLVSTYFPIDMAGEEPSLARFSRRLAAFARVVRFNPCGTGLSDPASPWSPPTFARRVEHAIAVMDAVGGTRAAVFTLGWQAGG